MIAKHRLKGHAGRCYITITSSADLLDVDLPLPGESSVRCRGETAKPSKACDAALNQIESTTLSHRSPQGPTPKAPALNQKNAGWPGRIFHAMAEYFQNCQKTDASLHKYIMCSSVSCAIQCCSGFCQICQKGDIAAVAGPCQKSELAQGCANLYYTSMSREEARSEELPGLKAALSTRNPEMGGQALSVHRSNQIVECSCSSAVSPPRRTAIVKLTSDSRLVACRDWERGSLSTPPLQTSWRRRVAETPSNVVTGASALLHRMRFLHYPTPVLGT